MTVLHLRLKLPILAGLTVAATLAVVPAALAGKGGGGITGSSTSCTPAAPQVSIDNNYAWGSRGSWGLPGQQLMYGVQVGNYDDGCGASTFTIAVAAPSGFSVSVPTNSITLGSSSSGYLWVYVTSPSVVADGDYPLTVTVQRSGASTAQGSGTSYYKVYSSDTSAPTLFWSSLSDGQAISGTSYTVSVSSSDDHAVRKIDLYLDGAYVSTTNCDDISYICQLSYKWSLNRARGSHIATFRSTDWSGNVGVLSVGFAVVK